MKRAGRIALDIEADSLHHYFEKVCLIQLTLDDRNYIVDPLSGIDLTAFLNVLAEKPLLLHSAYYDLQMLRSSSGFRPKAEVFDTMLAAQLLGYERLGLAFLMQEFFDVTLEKHGQKSDWSRRPLSKAQLDYAVDDTHYLGLLADRLARELRKLDRSGWHREACEYMVKSTARDSPRDPEDVWRIKGWSLLEPRQLNFLRELWQWREKEAQRTDCPSFKIMGNQKLVDLAGWTASNPGRSLLRGPKLPRNCTGRRLRTLSKAVRKACNTRHSDWPSPRRRRHSKRFRAEYTPQFEALRAECSHIAHGRNLPPSVLAPRAMLEAIAQERPHTIEEIMARGPTMRWQAKILQAVVEKVLTELRPRHVSDP